MTFPVVFNVFGLSMHPHPVFEVLAYTCGFQTFLLLRRRRRDHAVAVEPMLWIFVGCVFGALVGSKVLAWLESWPEYWARRHDAIVWIEGKTIVGGLIGGWGGVEVAKKILGVRTRTGDAYVVPVCLGIAIGRIGCFLSGLPDHTHGVPTNLPWAIDFGDGVPRHPTQLYEIAALIAMAMAFLVWSPSLGGGIEGGGSSPDAKPLATAEVPPHPNPLRQGRGDRFRLFIAGYMVFRFAVEFIKPSWKGYAGLSAIQWAAMITTIIALLQLRQSRLEGVLQRER